MEKFKILWIDDEVDLLKPHILFLEDKGFFVNSETNGSDALITLKNKHFDIIFLDENMPGLSGIETLSEIKKITNTPVVMITKSEEESIMEDAIGGKITDYLIKPVNPHQILSTIKRNLDIDRLIHNTTQSNYRKDYTLISQSINIANSFNDWQKIYKEIVKWELDLDNLNDNSMKEVLSMQKEEANKSFFKYIKSDYMNWFSDKESAPILSNNLLKQKVLPIISSRPLFFILIDNFRLDQWWLIKPLLEQFFIVSEDSTYFSILPTSTQYARNSLFSGLTPIKIKEKFSELWSEDHDSGGKNLHEETFLNAFLKREGLKHKTSFNKILNLEAGKKMINRVKDLMTNDFNVIIYNFVDILSHAKTDVKMIKELAGDEKAYRDLTFTWFKNSPLFELLKILSSLDVDIVITTDHGTINVENPSKVIGEKNISSNLRYKTGRRIDFESKDVFCVETPSLLELPYSNLSSVYIFAGNKYFFAYPNNYNYYVNYYKNTYQHGGISLEEMIIPFVHLSKKSE